MRSALCYAVSTTMGASMKPVSLIAGIIPVLAGLVWAGQGLGIVTWHPAGSAPSFMVNNHVWVYYGAALAVLGLFVIAWSRRGSEKIVLGEDGADVALPFAVIFGEKFLGA